MNGGKNALTLVEVLVLILVVVVLTVLLIPVFLQSKHGDGGRTIRNAKQISLGLKQYAVDFDGAYPRYLNPKEKTGDPKSSNEILKALIPDYLGDEKVFDVNGSAWASPGPDGNITTDADKLNAGENGWFYIAGLHDDDNPRWPVLATAPKPGSETKPLYVDKTRVKGGIWEGKKAVVLRADGSARVESTVDFTGKLTGKGYRHVPRDDDPAKNALKYDRTTSPPWLKPRPEVLYLNPL